MIISESRKYLMVAIPKTGGTSVKVALADPVAASPRDVLIDGQIVLVRAEDGRAMTRAAERTVRAVETSYPNWPLDAVDPDTDLQLYKHSNLRQARRFLGKKFFMSLRKIVIVRNPYARTYSAWKYNLKVSAGNPQLRAIMYQGDDPVSLADFLKSGNAKKMIASRPQTNWILPNRMPHRVLRTENLAEDLREAMVALQYPDRMVEASFAKASAKRENASADPEEWKSMTADEFALIADMYKVDFDRFNYEIDAKEAVKTV